MVAAPFPTRISHGACRSWLALHNSQYFARPNNTGRALFRYVAHADLDLYKNKVAVRRHKFFTDREASRT